MESFKRKATECAQFLKTRIDKSPEIAILTGTGLGDCVKSLDISVTIAYENIPYFPVATVVSHFGKLLFGKMKGKSVIVMQGRFHLYEGYSPLEVTFPIRVMQELGIKCLILSNAAGGLDARFTSGNIMIITDHINLTGANPLIGSNEGSWGVRFPDMTGAYDKSLQKLAEKAGQEARIDLKKGVYVGLKGPSLETPAEIRFLRRIGAEAVGFSTIHEVIAAVHAGMKVLGLSIITNVHNPDQPVPASVDEIIAIAKSAVPSLETVIQNVIQKL